MPDVRMAVVATIYCPACGKRCPETIEPDAETLSRTHPDDLPRAFEVPLQSLAMQRHGWRPTQRYEDTSRTYVEHVLCGECAR